ncbi:unnamed protein product [Thlaspi arvense]|uniref:CUE domain-containing protein n=1 Tax=Thlaspi arvense TaxID=13288 RepID=A0AAU9T260_THLAR|nr:unnamed protein product [Thlaspi arvense]
MTETSSSLNPYAAAYIPLSRRAVIGENKNCSLTEKDSDVVSETLWEDQFKNMTLNQSKASQNYIDHGILASELTKGNTFHSSYGSSSQNSSKITEKQIMDDEFDMGLAYLQMKFPGISDNSLYEIYLANSGDLEATIDMLHQLELN